MAGPSTETLEFARPNLGNGAYAERPWWDSAFQLANTGLGMYLGGVNQDRADQVSLEKARITAATEAKKQGIGGAGVSMNLVLIGLAILALFWFLKK